MTLDCGQPFKKVLSFVGYTGYRPFVTDKSRSQPEEGLLVLQMHGQPDHGIGDHFLIEIEPVL